MSAIAEHERTCTHEAAHVAGLVLAGMIPRCAEVAPNGRVIIDWAQYTVDQNPRGVMRAVLAGPLSEGVAPPKWPVSTDRGSDEQALAKLITHLGFDRSDYERSVRETYELIASAEFCELEHRFAYALKRWPVLDARFIRQLLGSERVTKYIETSDGRQNDSRDQR